MSYLTLASEDGEGCLSSQEIRMYHAVEQKQLLFLFDGGHFDKVGPLFYTECITKFLTGNWCLMEKKLSLSKSAAVHFLYN